MTNLEKIRTLSAKEMQEFLDNRTNCQSCFYFHKMCWEYKEIRCEDGMIKWLQAEHKDD